MPDIAFIQNSRIGRKLFLLKDDYIEVALTVRGGKQQERISLKTVDREYERIARRFPVLVVIPLVFGGLCLWIVQAILTQETLPHPFGIYPGLFALSFLSAAVRGIPKIDTFQFYNHWKRPIFYIVRERKQAEECDSFVAELVRRIQSAEDGVRSPPDTHQNGNVKVGLSANNVEVLLAGEHRWKASIVLGALSAGLPWLTQITHVFDDCLFMLIFAATVGGIGFCVLSLQVKERFRFFSVVGAALSLVAPLLYR